MKACLKVMLISIVCSIFMAGCQNTVQGFGKDMENSGQEIQKAVDK